MERHRQCCACRLAFTVPLAYSQTLRLYNEKRKESSFQVLYCVRFKVYLSVHIPLPILLRNRQGLLGSCGLKTRLLSVCLLACFR